MKSNLNIVCIYERGQLRVAAVFFCTIEKFSELSYDTKILCASRSEEIIASQSARTRQKCASC